MEVLANATMLTLLQDNVYQINTLHTLTYTVLYVNYSSTELEKKRNAGEEFLKYVEENFKMSWRKEEQINYFFITLISIPILFFKVIRLKRS